MKYVSLSEAGPISPHCSTRSSVARLLPSPATAKILPGIRAYPREQFVAPMPGQVVEI